MTTEEKPKQEWRVPDHAEFLPEPDADFYQVHKDDPAEWGDAVPFGDTVDPDTE